MPTSAPPKVFISATSGDLRTIRQVVKEALLTIHCHPIEQTNFEPDWRTVEQMLRGRIEECQALIHIAGLRYGAEPDPATRPADTTRRSYTQMEYDIGRELQKERGDGRFRVYTFICPHEFPYDTPVDFAGKPMPPEAEEVRVLQEKHRTDLLGSPHLFEQPMSVAALRERVLVLQEQVLKLQNEQREVREEVQKARHWGIWAAAAILLVLAGLGWHFTQRAVEVKKEVQTIQADPEQLRTRLRQQIEEKATAEIAAERAGKNDWRAVNEIEKRRETALSKVDDIVTTIRAGLAGKPEPVFLEATRVLNDKGPEEALAYLESQQQRLLDEASKLGTLEAELKQRRQDKLRPLLLQANLHESRLQWEPAVKLLEQVVAQTPDWWPARDQLGKTLLKLARYPEAEKHLRAGESLAGTDGERAAALNNLATLLQATNRAKEAEPLIRQALALDEKSYGKDDPRVAIRLSNLASLLQETNRMAEAEPLLRRALAINEASYGNQHPRMSLVLNNLALLLETTNRPAEAEPLLRRALAMDEAKFGPNDPNVALRLHNLAHLLQETNRMAEAEPLLRRALAINEAVYGRRHPSVAQGLNNLAELLEATNRMKEAESMMKEAIAIDEACYGKDHPQVAIGLNNLGSLFQATDRLAEAEPLMRRALQIQETSYGKDHPNVAVCLNNLAQVLEATDRLPEAESLTRRALAIHEASYGKNHPAVAISLNNLSAMLRETDRLAEAEPLMKRVVEILQTSQGENHPELATALTNLGLLYQATNRPGEAEPLMRRALAIDEASYGKDHPDVAVDLTNLASLLQTTNRLEEAEALARRAVRIFMLFRVKTGHPHPHMVGDIRNYLTICDALKLEPLEVRKRVEDDRTAVGMEDAVFDGIMREVFEVFGAGANETIKAQVVIKEVEADGQGAGLGLKAGDVIVRYAGEEIMNIAQFSRVRKAAKGDGVDLEVRRGEKVMRFKVKAGMLGVVLGNQPRP